MPRRNKNVPQTFMKRPTVGAFERMVKTSDPGKGRKKAKRIKESKRNKHGRQHP